MKNENIRFIRRNGRVIPIKVKGGFKPVKNKKPSKAKLGMQSAGFAVAGLGVSAGTRSLISKSIKKTDKLMRLSTKSFSILSPSSALEASEKFTEKARKQIKFSKRSLIGGQILGGALLSQAFQRGLRSQGIEIDNPAVDVGAEIGSQVASAIIVKRSKDIFNKKSAITVTKRIGKFFLKRKFKF